MASENIAKILFDSEIVSDVGALRSLLASGRLRQGERFLQNRNERVDTKDGPITVGGSKTIHDWPDHSVN